MSQRLLRNRIVEVGEEEEMQFGPYRQNAMEETERQSEEIGCGQERETVESEKVVQEVEVSGSRQTELPVNVPTTTRLPGCQASICSCS
jgi:hypothetical protein